MDDINELQQLQFLLEELKKRDEHASNTYVPLPKQLPFHQSKHHTRLIFGGNRSGKSRAAAQEVYWWFTGTHPYQTTPKAPRIWIISAEYRTIYEGIWLHLKNVLPTWDIAKVGPKVPNWDVPSYVESKNGARIDFISAQGGEETRKKLQAAEIDLVEIDEEIDGALITEIEFRLVTRGGRMTVSATLVESEDWLINLEAMADQGHPDVFKVQLDTRENKFNDQEAVERIISKLSDEEYQVRILGQSRKFSGLVYSNFIEVKDAPGAHVVPRRPIPEATNRVMVFDPGLRTAAALWIALHPDGRSELYREMYLHNTELPLIIEFWRRAEGWYFDENVWQPGLNTEIITTRIIDPAGFNRNVDGSRAIGTRLLEDYGYMFEKGNNNKQSNIEDVRLLLMPRLDGIPSLLVQEHLEKFLWERRRYRLKGDKGARDKDASRDLPVKRDDHLMNCIEYYASHNITYQSYSATSSIEEMAKMDDEEVDYPADPKKIRDFRLKLWKTRMQLARSQAMEQDNYDLYGGE